MPFAVALPGSVVVAPPSAHHALCVVGGPGGPGHMFGLRESIEAKENATYIIPYDPCREHLPTFTIYNFKPNLGKHSLHGASEHGVLLLFWSFFSWRMRNYTFICHYEPGWRSISIRTLSWIFGYDQTEPGVPKNSKSWWSWMNDLFVHLSQVRTSTFSYFFYPISSVVAWYIYRSMNGWFLGFSCR